MPMNPSRGENKDEFIGRCIGHEVGKGKSKEQAAAICYNIWEENLSEHSMKIMFSKDIPANIIKEYVKLGYQVYIWGGDGLFTKQAPAFKLAKQSGINDHRIFWGKLKWVMDNNNIQLFMSKEDMWDLDGFIKYVHNNEINLADEEGVGREIEERWVIHPDETKSGKSCPICVTLSKMEWVNKSRPVEYRWNGESKYLNGTGLPPYRRAHSEVGDGNWKVSDFYCKCSKQVRLAPMSLSKQEPLVINLHKCDE